MIKIVTILFALVLLVQTPQQAATVLTDKQKAEWAQLQQDERQQAQALQAIVMDALNLELGPTTSILFHAQIREAQLKLGSLQAQKAAWLARLQLESNCKDCVIEGDRLTKPK